MERVVRTLQTLRFLDIGYVPVLEHLKLRALEQGSCEVGPHLHLLEHLPIAMTAVQKWQLLRKGNE